MASKKPTTRAERARRTEQASTLIEYEHVPPPTPRRHLTDEELLLVAVLQRALLDYAQVRLAKEEGKWLKGDVATHESGAANRGYWAWGDTDPQWTERPEPAPYFFELVGAEEWIEERSSTPFSFEHCCWQGLGQDPELIRATVRTHWRRLLKPEAALIFATYTPPKDTDDADL